MLLPWVHLTVQTCYICTSYLQRYPFTLLQSTCAIVFGPALLWCLVWHQIFQIWCSHWVQNWLILKKKKDRWARLLLLICTNKNLSSNSITDVLALMRQQCGFLIWNRLIFCCWIHDTFVTFAYTIFCRKWQSLRQENFLLMCKWTNNTIVTSTAKLVWYSTVRFGSVWCV